MPGNLCLTSRFSVLLIPLRKSAMKNFSSMCDSSWPSTISQPLQTQMGKYTWKEVWFIFEFLKAHWCFPVSWCQIKSPGYEQYTNVTFFCFQITALKIKYNPFAKAFLDAKERWENSNYALWAEKYAERWNIAVNSIFWMFSYLTVQYTFLTEAITKRWWKNPETASSLGTPNVRFVVRCLVDPVSGLDGWVGHSRLGLLGVVGGRLAALCARRSVPLQAEVFSLCSLQTGCSSG